LKSGTPSTTTLLSLEASDQPVQNEKTKIVDGSSSSLIIGSGVCIMVLTVIVFLLVIINRCRSHKVRPEIAEEEMTSVAASKGV